jgi:hypothetical protein
VSVVVVSFLLRVLDILELTSPVSLSASVFRTLDALKRVDVRIFLGILSRPQPFIQGLKTRHAQCLLYLASDEKVWE